jgi:hypothetical protein
MGVLKNDQSRWAAMALLIPAAVYAGVAMSANLNIGLRHAFPVYPFAFVGIGLAAGRGWSFGIPGRAMVIVLALGLALETLAAFPNYISFVGVAFGGQRFGYRLLTDSNLDWGQDLPALADWQHDHPGVPVFLDYYGRCDPAAYGVRATALQDQTLPDRPGMLAVSASSLHLLAASQSPPAWFGLIKNRGPGAILNGTIYLFRIEPSHSD